MAVSWECPIQYERVCSYLVVVQQVEHDRGPASAVLQRNSPLTSTLPGLTIVYPYTPGQALHTTLSTTATYTQHAVLTAIHPLVLYHLALAGFALSNTPYWQHSPR